MFDLSKEFQSFIDNCDEIIVLKETKKIGNVQHV